METFKDNFSIYEIRGRYANDRNFRSIVLVPELRDAVTMARGVMRGKKMRAVTVYDAIAGHMVFHDEKTLG